VRMQSLADIESKIASADERGFERGLERGIEIIALNMLNKGIPTIAEVTGLSEAFIQLHYSIHSY